MPVQRHLIRLSAIVLLGSFILGACGNTAVSSIVSASPTEAAAVFDENPEAVILDIRTPEEVAEGRVPGAQNIDFYAADFKSQIESLDPDATYIVYCRSGNRTSQARPIFEDLGFADVTLVDGGIVAWANAGLPLEG